LTASAADVAALRAAVRPVYDQLERDQETRSLVAAITDMRNGVEAQPEPPRCPRLGDEAASSKTSRIEGRWETTWTEAELLEAGLPQADARSLAGPKTTVFRAGRFRAELGGGNSAIGAYEVDGPVVSLVFERGIGVQLGRVYQLRWSVYRDSITYAAVPGSEPLSAMLIKPWKRTR